MVQIYRIGTHIKIRAYIESEYTQPNVERLRQALLAFPFLFEREVYPILIIERNHAGVGGGTWPPHLVRNLLGREATTGVPDSDLNDIILWGNGVIGIHRGKWERPIGKVLATVFHEIGHSIDMSLGGLAPRGASVTDFPGMNSDRSKCGAGNPVTRQAVEAFARFYTNPSHICHFLPSGTTVREANQRIRNTLARSPAFQRLPEDQRP